MSTTILRAISRPIDGDDIPSTSALLGYFARVSSSANQGNHDTAGKLLRSLVKRKEWSPFEMVSLTIEINTTRDIGRQILRHRSFSFQEFSQRYAEVMEPLEAREARLQHATDRQMSIETATDDEIREWWLEKQTQFGKYVKDLYTQALGNGVAKEVARSILPEGMTPTQMYMAGTLRSWLHYVFLRCDQKTQKEHRLIAEGCRAILCREFPDLEDLIMWDGTE